MKMIADHRVIEESRSRVQANRAWLSPPDASTNHNFASRSQHQGTATWFFKGNLSNEWKSKSTTSLLWIHGKRASFCSSHSFPILISSNHFSGLGKERPLVGYQILNAQPRNLHHQPALQSSEK